MRLLDFWQAKREPNNKFCVRGMYFHGEAMQTLLVWAKPMGKNTQDKKYPLNPPPKNKPQSLLITWNKMQDGVGFKYLEE